MQKTIFAPKAHLHSSAKVRYLDFGVSAHSTDAHELQSDRMSGRPAPQTASTAPQPCPTPTASSATLKPRARSHTADLSPIIFGDGHGFWVPQKCAAGALFSKRKQRTNLKFKKPLFSRRRRTYIRVPKYGTLIFACPRIRQIEQNFRATERVRESTLRPRRSLPDLAPQLLRATGC